jgi:hypothetical protein
MSPSSTMCVSIFKDPNLYVRSSVPRLAFYYPDVHYCASAHHARKSESPKDPSQQEIISISYICQLSSD